MTPAELRQLAEAKIAWWQQHEMTGEPLMQLLLKGEARGERVRLAGRSGPMGHIIADQPGGTLAAFPCRKVLAWLQKAGA